MNFTFVGFDSEALYFNDTISYCSRCIKQKNSDDQLEELNLLLLRDMFRFESECKSTTRKVCKECKMFEISRITTMFYIN